MKARRTLRRRGFTLLEVMVALAILGLGLTVILSSQTGLLAAVGRIRGETYAEELLRCRMTEIELQLAMKGFELLDDLGQGECCEDEDEPGYSCEWKIETVELPDPTKVEEDLAEADKKDAAQDGKTAKSATTPPGSKTTPAGPTGVMGALGTIEQSGGAALGKGKGGLGDLGTMLSDSSGGSKGMISMGLSLVYPTLKPMLEASIRRVTVTVKWHEGEKDRDFSVVQYITNPMEGSLNPNAAQVLDQMSSLTGGTAPGQTGQNSSGQNSGSAATPGATQ